MHRYCLFLFTLLFQTCFADIGHQSDGTNYSSQGVAAYEKNRHGNDGALFLDPCFLPELSNLNGEILFDAGCGAGPWSVYAAKYGAIVYGVDIQAGMIERAEIASQKNGVEDQTFFSVGTVAQLPYLDDFFDYGISINVGCNLPNGIFSTHFSELNRTLKRGGKIVVTAPASFGTLFTNGEDPLLIRNKIENALLMVGDSDSPKLILQALNGLEEVLRATFAIRDGKLKLIETEEELVEGECIWRKIPGLAVPNFYHSEEAYEKVIELSGLQIERVDRLLFDSEAQWYEYSSKLGQEYMHHHPFVVFHLTKG